VVEGEPPVPELIDVPALVPPVTAALLLLKPDWPVVDVLASPELLLVKPALD
jgi:hypothetical protein